MKTMTVSAFNQALVSIANGISSVDYTPALEDCAQAIADQEREAFRTATSPAGKVWPPLLTKRKRTGVVAGSRGVRGNHPLVRSGLLMAAASVKDASVPGAIRDYTPKSLEYGVDADIIPYAAVHQFGYKPMNIPEREYLDINNATEQKVVTIVEDFLWKHIANNASTFFGLGVSP